MHLVKQKLSWIVLVWDHFLDLAFIHSLILLLFHLVEEDHLVLLVE